MIISAALNPAVEPNDLALGAQLHSDGASIGAVARRIGLARDTAPAALYEGSEYRASAVLLGWMLASTAAAARKEGHVPAVAPTITPSWSPADDQALESLIAAAIIAEEDLVAPAAPEQPVDAATGLTVDEAMRLLVRSETVLQRAGADALVKLGIGYYEAEIAALDEGGDSLFADLVEPQPGLPAAALLDDLDEADIRDVLVAELVADPGLRAEFADAQLAMSERVVQAFLSARDYDLALRALKALGVDLKAA